MPVFWTTALFIGLLAGVPVTPLVADETGTAKAANSFFAGTVSQFSAETMQRLLPERNRVWNGTVAFIPASLTSSGDDLFRK